MSPLTTPGRFDGALAKAALTTALLMTWALATSAMTWGLPDGRGWAPDEIIPGTVIAGLTAWFSDGWHSIYPPLHFYLLAIVLLPFQIMAHVGLLDLSSTQTYLAMFLLQRGVSVVLAGATLYLVYRCGLALHGSRTAGMGSALLVASMPTFNYYANLANVDVPYTFWLTFSLWLYIQFVRTHHPRALYGFALTATLAICTKDQAYGFYALPAAHILWLHWRTAPDGSRRAPWRDPHLRGAFGVSVLTFVLVHNLVFNYEGFVTHLQIILGHTSYPGYDRSLGGHLLMARDAVWQLGWSMGWPALAVCLSGVAVAFRSPRSQTRWFLLPVASYYLSFISVIMYHFDRFFLGVAVILAVYGGGALARLTASGRGMFWRRLLCALVLGYGVIYGAAPAWLMNHDARYFVEQWSRVNISQSESIGLVGFGEYLPRFPQHRTMRLQESWSAAQSQRPNIIVINTQFASRANFNPDAHEARNFYARLNDPNNGQYEQILTHRTTPWWAFVAPEWVFWPMHAGGTFYTNLAKINPEIRVFRRSTLRYASGWYQEETASASTWRWTQQTATLSFVNPQADATFSLEYAARPNVFADAPQVVTVSLGDQQVLQSFVAETAGRHRLRIPLSADALGNEDIAEIQITVDRTFVPANLLVDSRDARELGIQVYHAAVERDPSSTP